MKNDPLYRVPLSNRPSVSPLRFTTVERQLADLDKEIDTLDNELASVIEDVQSVQEHVETHCDQLSSVFDELENVDNRIRNHATGSLLMLAVVKSLSTRVEELHDRVAFLEGRITV